MEIKDIPRIYFIGAFSIILAAVFSLAGSVFAPIPLFLFIVICLAAPFFPGLQLFLVSVMHGDRKKNAVSLTFDDGPDPETTPYILDFLKQKKLKAAFFVVGQKAQKHPDLISAILAGSHSVGNHTMQHDVFIMLRGTQRLESEIAGCRDVLRGFGINALAFRPPAGIVNPRLGGILFRLGLFCLMFSRRGLDFGNRKLDDISRNVLKGLRPGDIIMLHDRMPPHGIPVSRLIGQIDEVITGIKAKGLDIIPVEDLTGTKVMEEI